MPCSLPNTQHRTELHPKTPFIPPGTNRCPWKKRAAWGCLSAGWWQLLHLKRRAGRLKECGAAGTLRESLRTFLKVRWQVQEAPAAGDFVPRRSKLLPPWLREYKQSLQTMMGGGPSLPFLIPAQPSAPAGGRFHGKGQMPVV